MSSHINPDGDPARVTLHADRELVPEVAGALADLARATVESTTRTSPEPRSYAVFVCTRGVIGCRSMGEHREHDLAKNPFLKAWRPIAPGNPA